MIKNLQSNRVIVSCDADRRAALMRWLQLEFGLSREHVSTLVSDSEIDFPEDGKTPVSGQRLRDVPGLSDKTSAVVLCHREPREARAAFIAAGFNDIYDCSRIDLDAHPVKRLREGASALHVGPQLAAGPADPGFSRYTAPRRTPDAIPRDLVFCVNSLPRSGTVWLAAMLEALLEVTADHRITLSHVNDIREIWVRENLHGAVTLVRDLRDVVVSFHHHVQQNDLTSGFAQPRFASIEETYFNYFLGLIEHEERYCFGRLIDWINFVASRAIPIIRYEDLLGSTEAQLEKLLCFWRIDVDAPVISAVSARFRFGEMSRAVEPGPTRLGQLMARGHLRQGQAGNWKSELPEKVAEDIGTRFSDFQSRFGYMP